MVSQTTVGAVRRIWREEPHATSDEVKVWLEWAGRRLLCLRLRSPNPAGYRSFWPEYVDDYKASNTERFRVPAVQPGDLFYMDTILELPNLIPDAQRRRIIHARALVTPLSERYVNSFRKIAEREYTDERKAARLYVIGLREIAANISFDKASVIRSFLAV